MRVARSEPESGASFPYPAEPELGLALSQGLNLPLAALRASMESLSRELDGKPAEPLIDSVLREVAQLGHNVQELVDFATPPVPMPLRCSMDEIVNGARDRLAPERRGRLMIARFANARFAVDGPLLVRCLRRLIENSFEAGSEKVLLSARSAGNAIAFNVLDNAPERLDADWALPAFRSTKRNHMGLGLAIVQRDVALLDGELDFICSQLGNTNARVSVPKKRPQEIVT